MPAQAFTLGVWIQLPHPVELRTEGLGRVLAALLGPLAARRDVQLVIALPRGSLETFAGLLADWQIDPERLDYIGGPAPRSVAARPSSLTRQARRVIARLRKTLSRFEYRRLVRASNRRRVDAWLVLLPGSDHARHLAAPRVVVIPDLVYVDFPAAYPDAWTRDMDRRVRAAVSGAARIVTFSEHVAAQHVRAHLGVPPQSVDVIRHGSHDCRGALPRTADGPPDRASAARRLHEFIQGRAGHLESWRPLTTIRFDSRPFLFVSSQVRPTKNVRNLLAAFALLADRRASGLLLVLTGSLLEPLDGVPVHEHVRRAGLTDQVVSLHNLPSDVHAACFSLAALTVIPTLFEGGFPFPFAESLSVGTPVLMSDIPVVREIIPVDCRRMLFDPHNVAEMASKLESGLDDRAELLALEQRVYAPLRERTWERVADEYLRVLRRAAGRD